MSKTKKLPPLQTVNLGVMLQADSAYTPGSIFVSIPRTPTTRVIERYVSLAWLSPETRELVRAEIAALATGQQER